MRVFLLALAATSLSHSTQTQAAPNAAQPARRVQLIAMGAPATDDSPAPDRLAQSVDTAAADSAQASPNFKIHDLSRRWVEFQMASHFAGENASSAPAAPENPFAPVGVAEPDVYAAQMTVSPASSIAVPDWMQGGAAFTSANDSYVPGCIAPGYRPTGFLASDAELRRANYYSMMSAIACQHGIPVGLFDAMIIQESRYRPDAFSPKSAFGLTQLMPGTALALGVNRYSVEENLHGGARYLRRQLDRFGQYHLALAAYNAGPGRVRNGLIPQIAETRAYVGNVLQNWARLSGGYRQAVSVPPAPAIDKANTRPTGRNAAVFTF